MQRLSTLPFVCLFAAAAVLTHRFTFAPSDVQIVTVQRGDIHQVCAVTGYIAYKDEMLLLAPESGQIARVCVSPGQRVGAGDALLRYAADQTQPVVLRAAQPCTVREVYATRGMVVSAGTQLLRISSNVQEIRCLVPNDTIDELHTGMWGWISVNSNALGFAELIQINGVAFDPSVTLLTLMPDQPLAFPEGTEINISLFLSGSDDVLTLPLEAITARQTVWWVHDGKCTEIPAEVVMSDEKRAWVRLPEGLCVAVGEYSEGQHVTHASD